MIYDEIREQLVEYLSDPSNFRYLSKMYHADDIMQAIDELECQIEDLESERRCNSCTR